MGFDVKTCSKYQALLNFTDQAMALVQDLQKAYPRDQFILTGHSLGGMLAILTAGDPRVTRGDAVALAFAPTPWRKVAQLQGEADGLVALCGINSFFVPGARLAASTCLFLHQEEPKPCQGLPEPYETSRWRDELLRARPGDPLTPDLTTRTWRESPECPRTRSHLVLDSYSPFLGNAIVITVGFWSQGRRSAALNAGLYSLLRMVTVPYFARWDCRLKDRSLENLLERQREVTVAFAGSIKDRPPYFVFRERLLVAGAIDRLHLANDSRVLFEVFEATDDERYTFAKDYKDLSRFHIEIDNKRTK
eukprot:g12708.t1